MKRRLIRRCLAVLLALLMVFALAPTAAFAGDEVNDLESDGIETDGITVNVIAAVHQQGDWEILYPEGENTEITVAASADDTPTLIDAVYTVDPNARISSDGLDVFLELGSEPGPKTDPGLDVDKEINREINGETDPGQGPEDEQTPPEKTGWWCSVNDEAVTDYNRSLESDDNIVFFHHSDSVEEPGWDSLVELLKAGSETEPGDSNPVTPVPDPEITVHFTLQGLSGSLKEETWCRESVTMKKGASAADVIIKILREKHYNATILYDNNYIESITTPHGFTLTAGHNDMPNSGWLYKVNSQMPDVGMAAYVLEDGDHILLYFTKDYTLDPDAGVNPGNEKTPEEEGGPTSTPKIEITPVVRDGIAVATVHGGAVKEALEKLKDSETEDAREIKVTVEAASGASASLVELKAGDVKAIAGADNVQLTVESAIAAVTLDTETLAGITKGIADNAIIRLTVATVDTAAVDAEKQAVIGNAPAVFDLRIDIGDKPVTRFAGEATVFLPFTPDTDTDTKKLTVYHLGTDMETTPLKDTHYDAERGGFVFTTDHFSLFFIAEAAETPLDEDWTNPFTDVKETDWFFDVVKYININQLMAGTANDKFSPQAPMTRAMLVTVLHRYAGEPTAAAGPFTDVAPGAWYAPAVAWAAENGIVTGYGNDLFGAHDSVTREQMAAILRNYAEKEGWDVSPSADLAAYRDAAIISPWARQAVGWAAAKDLLRGRSGTTLAPRETITRAEVGTVLMRYIEDRAA